MLNRRGALMGLLGGAAAGPSVVKTALDSSAINGLTAISGAAIDPDEGWGEVGCRPRSKLAQKATSLFYRRGSEKDEMAWAYGRLSRGEVPPSLSSKKSWSGAFKAHVVETERREDRIIREILDGDMSDVVAAKLIDILTS